MVTRAKETPEGVAVFGRVISSPKFLLPSPKHFLRVNLMPCLPSCRSAPVLHLPDGFFLP